MNQIQNICIFASSSESLEQPFYELAESLGRAVASSGAGMVFGGGSRGLMGAVARGTAQAGGRITGVIPEKLNRPGVAYPGCTRLIETPTMHVRKQTMEDLSDAFIALPGGFGTLEEVLETITLRQLGYHEKPVVLLNYGGFYDSLLEQFERLYAESFASVAYRNAYRVAQSVEEAVRLVYTFRPVTLPDKLGGQAEPL